MKPELKRKLTNILRHQSIISFLTFFLYCSCYLVTFYFAQLLLPKLRCMNIANKNECNEALDNIIVFIGEYGSYLKLDTCMAYAALLRADVVIDLLLSVAKNDPRHREVMKQTSKSNQLVFYEKVRYYFKLYLLSASFSLHIFL